MRSYEDRIRRVKRYIHDNPAGDLSLDALADVAAVSRFHWHRIYAAMTGETCAQAVRRIRAHRAACWLVQTDWSLDVIAARAGYGHRDSFERAFRAIYAMTPTAFRKRGQAPHDTPKSRTKEHLMQDINITDRAALRMAALPHRGAYPNIGRAFEEVSVIFTARGLWPQAQGMVAVFYDDPSTVAEADLRSHAGVCVGEAFEMPDALEDVLLPGGPHAELIFKGPYAGLPAAYDDLYGRWFPQSGRLPGAAASYEVYLNSPMDTEPAELLTKICAPLAP
ncbi:AraC family transcriptional regulator [Primorskyibacter sp. S187A]|uniref:AraC family transcriptional regulator n=1 Tax=Primorskyibacter sp. S187A TaxID=3415130 RepID=UPI003C7BEA36